MAAAISIPVFTLCDSVTIREGLLHILGAGISTIHHGNDFPHLLNAQIAVLVNFTGENSAPSRLRLAIRTETGESIGFDDLELVHEPDDSVDLNNNSIYSIPIVIDVSGMSIPEPGRYVFTFSVEDSEIYSKIEFDIN